MPEDEAGRRDGGQVQADDLEQPEIEEEQQEQDGHSPEKPHIDADEAAVNEGPYTCSTARGRPMQNPSARDPMTVMRVTTLP